jgi:hypothetical protein
MGWMHELAHSTGMQTCHTPDFHERGASAADMTQHLVQPTPPSHQGHIQVLITLGELGMVTG